MATVIYVIWRQLYYNLNRAFTSIKYKTLIMLNHFYYPTNALNYSKLKSLKSTLYKV